MLLRIHRNRKNIQKNIIKLLHSSEKQTRSKKEETVENFEKKEKKI